MHSVISMFGCPYPKKRKRHLELVIAVIFLVFVVDKKHYLPILSACTEYDMNTLFFKYQNIPKFNCLKSCDFRVS